MLLPFALVCVACLLILGVAALVVRCSFLIYGGVLAVCTALGLLGFLSLIGDVGAQSVVLPFGLPWMGAHFRIDSLSAFFLIVVNLGAGVASLYALGYGKHELAQTRILPFYPAFVAGMNAVVLADDAFVFLVSWEFMSLSSWALVMAHHKIVDNVRAGYIYIVMASFGTLALLLAFGLMAGEEGGYAFSVMRMADFASWKSGLVLFLVLLGAGSKAGLVPLHVWLPLAHPAAPSHVSALMSGVMTKVAIYGFIRIIIDLMGGTDSTGAMVVLFLGGITAVMGVLYALMQHDLKRLLAYHTVENIGIIFIGLGLYLAFHAYDAPAFAALALIAALFHVFNHCVFKSLLFFGSGAILTATGLRDMERLGGLIHGMPRTALVFLIGCAAISALPPLNGFVSEWLTFQAILQGPFIPHWGLKILIPLVGAMLALAAALAAACFVKVFGIVFLGRPRSEEARMAKEVDRFSVCAMGIFAAVCIVAGVLPGFVIDALAPVARDFAGVAMPIQITQEWLSVVPLEQGHSAYNGPLIFLFIIMASTFIAWLIHMFASRKVRRSDPWDCGFVCEDPLGVTQYTASSFAQPIRNVFGSYVFAATQRVKMPPPGSLSSAHFVAQVRDLIWEYIYAPIGVVVLRVADRLNFFQFSTIRRYLVLIFGSLVLLMLGFAIWF